MDTGSTSRNKFAKGRGAVSNPEGRFERLNRDPYDDGWAVEEEIPPLRTTVRIEQCRTIIAHNDSPDIPFDQSINPYRGCEHGCTYCLSGDTPILMGNGSTRPLADVRVGDSIYGTLRRGWYRRYVKTRVLDHWSVIKPAYRITLEDGTCLVAGADHRFLTERGWKFVTGAECGKARRPHLTIYNKLMGTGAFARPPIKNHDYRLGYLCGLIRGDGLLASYHYERPGRAHGDQHQFRLALCDVEALQQAREFLCDLQITTNEFVFQKAAAGYQTMHAIPTQARASVERIRDLIAWPNHPSVEWFAGFLAGIFDAEGSYSQSILRISNTDKEIIAWISRCLTNLDFRFSVEQVSRKRIKPIQVIRLNGGLREHLRFFHSVDPAITRKRDIASQAVKSDARLGVVSIEPLDKAQHLFDITTETGDFIANGVVSHNCYARPSHAYLGLSPGLDFEAKLFAKTNAAERLRVELAKPGYECHTLALGTNTDPYQPIERRYRIMRQIIEVLAECQHPLSIVTKSALIERDLDLLAPMARKGLVHAFVSITTLDRTLARRLEPRAAAPARRLETLQRLATAGIPVGVMVAPVIPALNDKDIEKILEQARAAGARWAGYVLLRLPHEVKDLFREWLARHEPLRAEHVMSLVQGARGGRDNDPRFGARMRGTGVVADLIENRFAVACRRLGFNQDECSLDHARFRPPAISPQLALF